MTVRSVRAAMSCMGLGTSGDVSVMWSVFGFRQARPPTDPVGGATVSMSLGETFAALSGRHVNLNMIAVGYDGLSAADRDRYINSVDWAAFRMREIYFSAGIGVGRVQHYEIAVANARGFDDIGSTDEADDLHDEWGVPNDGIDAFFVRTITAGSGGGTLLGRSPVDGDCEKNSKDDGLLAGGANNTNSDSVARTFTHETGHYLDLEHNHGDTCPTADGSRRNLMAQTRCVPNMAGTSTQDVRNAVNLTSSQGSTMRGHCMVKGGC